MVSSTTGCPSSRVGVLGYRPSPPLLSTPTTSTSTSTKVSTVEHYYEIPPRLNATTRSSMLDPHAREKVGIPVWKVDKYGSLVARRLAISSDGRQVWITSTAPSSSTTSCAFNTATTTTPSALWQAVTLTGAGSSSTSTPTPTSIKAIPIGTIDRIDQTCTSHRFLLAQQQPCKEQLLKQRKHRSDQSPNASSRTLKENAVLKQHEHNHAVEDCDDPYRCVGASPSTSSQCLSLVYSCGGGPHPNYNTLDVVVPNPDEYQLLYETFLELMQRHRNEQLKFRPEWFTFYHLWCYEFELEHHQTLQASNDSDEEILWNLWNRYQASPTRKDGASHVMMVMHLNRGRLSKWFRCACSQWQQHRNNETRHMMLTPNPNASHGFSKEQVFVVFEKWARLCFESTSRTKKVCQALTNVSEDNVDAIEQLWHDLVESDPIPSIRSRRRRPKEEGTGVDKSELEHDDETISAASFREFLQAQNYTTASSATSRAATSPVTLQDTIELIHAWNQQIKPSANHRRRDLRDVHLSVANVHAQSIQDDGAKNEEEADIHKDTNGDDDDDDEDNNQREILFQDRLTKRSFVAYLLSDSNDLVHPHLSQVGAQDMTKPLHQYYIATSHDSYLQCRSHSFDSSDNNNSSSTSSMASYLPSVKHGGGVDEQAYLMLLHRGVRCLELDVWDGLDGIQPVVAFRQPTSASHPRLSFQVVIQLVRAYVQDHPESFPILLKLETHASTTVQENMANILHEELERPRLLVKPSYLPPSTSTNGRRLRSPPVEWPSPESARGKVLILGKRTQHCTSYIWTNDFDADLAHPRSGEEGSNEVEDHHDDEEYDEVPGDDRDVVVGFDENGPIRIRLVSPEPPKTVSDRSTDDEEDDDPSVVQPPAWTPKELLQHAIDESDAAAKKLEIAVKRLQKLEEHANDLEAQAARYTIVSGWKPDDIKNRALKQLGLAKKLSSSPSTCLSQAQDDVTCSPTEATSGKDSAEKSQSLSGLTPLGQSSLYGGISMHDYPEASFDRTPLAEGTNRSTIIQIETDSESRHLFRGEGECLQLDVSSLKQSNQASCPLLQKDSSDVPSPDPVKHGMATVPESLVSANAVADPDAVYEYLAQELGIFDNAFESFVEERARARELVAGEETTFEHAFDTFLEERTLARDLASQFEEEGTKSKVDATIPRLESQLWDESFDTIPITKEKEPRNAVAGALSEIVGTEAVNLYVQALAVRQQAEAAADSVETCEKEFNSKSLALVHAHAYHDMMTRTVKVPANLSRLTYFHSTRHTSWSKSLALPSFQFHSFAHPVLVDLLQKNEERQKMLTFTKEHFCRVFPAAESSRGAKASNYDPVMFWTHGCQLVSCNYHSANESTLVADGFFRQNGNCGYVLKPPHLTEHITLPPRPQKWSFRILSGNYLPSPIDDKVVGLASPLVKLTVHSGSQNETRASFRTRPARHCGLERVVWNAPPQEVTLVAGSLVSWSVWHVMDCGTEIFMGASVFPASCLREGYRSVALFNEDHVRVGASCLLVQADRLS